MLAPGDFDHPRDVKNCLPRREKTPYHVANLPYHSRIVRKSDEVPAFVKHEPLLSPSPELFRKYREAYHTGVCFEVIDNKNQGRTYVTTRTLRTGY